MVSADQTKGYRRCIPGGFLYRSVLDTEELQQMAGEPRQRSTPLDDLEATRTLRNP